MFANLSSVGCIVLQFAHIGTEPPHVLWGPTVIIFVHLGVGRIN